MRHLSWIVTLAVFLFLATATTVSTAADVASTAKADDEYVSKFLEKYPRADQPISLENYASPEKFDAAHLGASIDNALKNVTNDSGGIAWGLTYQMHALNIMYRITGDVKYLEANLRMVRAVAAATDDKRDKKLFNGRVVKAWGCDLYAERGRALFAVHTGIITAQMLDFLLCARENKAFDTSLGAERTVLLQAALDALAEHDRQWRTGPEEGAGHYVGLDQENSLEGKPLPANRLSAMGWALWLSWKLTGNETHRGYALSIARYERNRFITSPDGAWYWPYQLAEQPVTTQQSREEINGEDLSHAGLTLSLPLLLVEEGQVFTRDDLNRLAKMALNGFARRDDGILFGTITGSPKSSPDLIGYAVNYLPIAQADPEVGRRIVNYYLNFRPKPAALDMVGLLLYKKQQRPKP